MLGDIMQGEQQHSTARRWPHCRAVRLDFRANRRALWLVVALATMGVALPGSTPADAAPAPQTLVAAGSAWRYDDSGTARNSAWRTIDFDDSGWREGRAELGYGDGDEATRLSFGPDALRKYVTTYFRRSFSVANPSNVSALALDLRRDDGAVVYVNGTEVFRTNMGSGPITAASYAMDWNTSETAWFPATVSPMLLRPGRNVLAVEIHQASNRSSDISFDLRLTATVGGSPPPAMLMLAGDIGHCGVDVARYTGAEVARRQGTWAPVGDLAYPDGSETDFRNCYDPHFAAVRDRTRPAIGNHEYESADGAYWNRFGPAVAGRRNEGWYSHDLGGWHIVVLNSNCDMVACNATGAQYRWLAADLAASTTPCVLSYFHHAPFSSETRGGTPGAMLPMLQLLEREGLDAVVGGHFHLYERFARMTSAGVVNARGFRTFVVGTGGGPLNRFGTPKPGSEVRHSDAFGFLELALRPNGYSWEFVHVGGTRRSDSGTDTC